MHEQAGELEQYCIANSYDFIVFLDLFPLSSWFGKAIAVLAIVVLWRQPDGSQRVWFLVNTLVFRINLFYNCSFFEKISQIAVSQRIECSLGAAPLPHVSRTCLSFPIGLARNHCAPGRHWVIVSSAPG